MILVDTCVWIDVLKGRVTPETRFLGSLSKSPLREVCLSRIVVFEILRGIASDLERRKVRQRLDTFVAVDYHNDGFENLLAIEQQCRCSGLNLPKLGDWLILKTVLDNDLDLLTSDKDFHAIHRIRPFRLLKL